MNTILAQGYDIRSYPREENGDIKINTESKFHDDYKFTNSGKYVTIKASKYINYFLKMLSSNQSIYENIFLRFRDRAKNYDKRLYVLACLKQKGAYEQFQEKGDLINNILEVSDMLEVFITDFDFVVPFDYVALGNANSFDKPENYTFVKYTIEDFCEVLRTQLLHSSVAHEYEAKCIDAGIYRIGKK